MKTEIIERKGKRFAVIPIRQFEQLVQDAEMLEDIREKRIEGLIFSKLARLARNTKELLEFAEIFRQESVGRRRRPFAFKARRCFRLSRMVQPP